MLDSASPLTAFQIEVARLLFGLSASDGSCSPGEVHCLHMVSRRDRRRTWTSSPAPMAAMSGAPVMSSSRQRERAAGASIPFRTARPSAVSSFTDPRIWSSTWRWTPHLGVRQAQLIGPTFAPDEHAGRASGRPARA